MDGAKIPLSVLLISAFFIFSIPNAKQNKKSQSPKDLNLFFVNKVRIFISLKTQPCRNSPHPSVGFGFFLFPSTAGVAGSAGMQVNVLVHCVP